MPLGVPKKTIFLLSGIGLLLAVIGVAIALFLINQPQDTRQKAAVEGGVARVKITPASATLEPGESTTATVAFSTEGRTIEGVTVQLTYPYEGSEPLVIPSDLKMEPVLESTGRFNCAVKNIVTTANPVTINFGCTTTTGYSNNAFADLFSFTLTAGEATTATTVPISFNTSRTIIADNGEDIAAIPTGNLLVSVAAAPEEKQMEIEYSASCNPSVFEATARLTQGTDEPVAGVTVQFTFNGQLEEAVTDSSGEATVSFTYNEADNYLLKVKADGFTEQSSNVSIAACPEATPEPTPTPISQVVSCNGSCITSEDCLSGLTCYGGYCRSPLCQSDVSCQCETVEVAAASSTSALPKTGSLDRTLAMLLIGGLLTAGGFQLLLHRQTIVKAELPQAEQE